MSDILERVRKIVVERLDVDPAEVTLEAGLKEDLGADSLDAVDLIMEVEDEFEISIEDEEAEGISTVGNIVEYINKKK